MNDCFYLVVVGFVAMGTSLWIFHASHRSGQSVLQSHDHSDVFTMRAASLYRSLKLGDGGPVPGRP